MLFLVDLYLPMRELMRLTATATRAGGDLRADVGLEDGERYASRVDFHRQPWDIEVPAMHRGARCGCPRVRVGMVRTLSRSEREDRWFEPILLGKLRSDR